MKTNILLIISLCCLLHSVAKSQNVTLYLEDFERPGDSSRYFLSHDFADNGNRSFFTVGTYSDFTSFPSGITGFTNNQFLGAENTDGTSGSPSNAIVSMITNTIVVDSFSDVIFTFDIGANTVGRYDSYALGNADFVDVDYRFDGGAWSRLMQFRNGPTASEQNQDVYRDLDLNNLGGEDGGAQLNKTLQRFSDTVNVTGSEVEFRILIASTSFNEEFFIDRVVLEGIPINTPPSTLNRMLYYDMGTTIENHRENLRAKPHASAVQYQFEISGTGFTTDTVTSSTNRFRLLDAEGLTYNRTYNFRHRIITSGGPGVWSDAYYGYWKIKVGEPSTKIRDNQCGSTIDLITDWIEFDLVGNATDYRMNISGPGGFNTVYQLNEEDYRFTLDDAGADTFGVYSITVNAFVDGDWTENAESCEITVSNPVSLKPEILLLNCGGELIIPRSLIRTNNVPSADFYQWNLIGTNATIYNDSIDKNNNKLRISEDFPIFEYGGTYDIRVRYSVDGNMSTWSDICSFSIPIPEATIYDPICGSEISSITSYISTQNFPNASAYEFHVFNTFFDTIFINSWNRFNLLDLDTSNNISSINVSVRPIIPSVTTFFGDTCALSYNSGSKLANPNSLNFRTKYFSNNDDFNVYPNPTEKFVRVSHPALNINGYKIYNPLGEIIESKIESTPLEFLDLNFEANNPGQYLIKIIDSDGKTHIARIVKY